MAPTEIQVEVRNGTDLHRWLRIERRLRRVPLPVLTATSRCLEHPHLRAMGWLTGLGPLCAPCITAQKRAAPTRRPRVQRCGCEFTRRCPFAAALWRRAHLAHDRMVATPEADQERRRKLARAYTEMMLVLRRHMEAD